MRIKDMRLRSTIPTNKAVRLGRHRRERLFDRAKEDKNRRNSAGGKPNELGVTQGQNGEQGNTVVPRNSEPLGKLEH